jgi:hypothetical protein
MKLPPGHVPGVGVPKASGFGGLGQRLLEQMGWSKGQGLGKEQDGMREAIEVKKKEDALGVSCAGVCGRGRTAAAAEPRRLALALALALALLLC